MSLVRATPAPIPHVSDEAFVASLARFAKPLRVYVAGPSREIERCERVIAQLRDLGVAITHDWTVQMRAAGKPDSAFETDELRPFLAADLDGVDAADVLLVLLPEYGSASSGMSVELGAGIARKRRGEPLRIVASRGVTAPDLTRCERCGWPLRERAEDGCVVGNCSQRPLPPKPEPHGPANCWARCFADHVLDFDAAAIAALRGLR